MTDKDENNNFEDADAPASLVGRLVIPLFNCSVCGHTPTSFSCGLRKYKGCDITVWVVECDHDEESEPFPYIEHRLTVYGKDKHEAEERWNDINRV